MIDIDTVLWEIHRLCEHLEVTVFILHVLHS